MSDTPTIRPARRRAWRAKLSQTLLTLCLLAFSIPLIWMLATSLKPGAEVFSSPPRLVGSEVRWANYLDVWTYVPFGRYMANGLLVAGLGTLTVVASSLFSGYAFSRLRFRGRDSIFFVFLATLMVPQEVIVVPMYLFFIQLGWVNTYQALTLPWAFTAFGTFLLRQALLTVPQELQDAARVDGAGHLQVLLRIMTPIVKPSIAVLVVFTFIGYWNNFLWPLIVVNDTEHTTVPLGLNIFLGQGGRQWHLIMAASAISMVPTVALAVGLQRYLIRGITLTGIAGR